jgi:hypothetical protein
MAVGDTLSIYTDQQLPDWSLAWRDGAGVLLNLSTYTQWRCEFVDQADKDWLTKTSGVGGGDGTGLSNVMVVWGPSDLASVPAGTYRVRISAVAQDGRRRYMPDDPPIMVTVKARSTT